MADPRIAVAVVTMGNRPAEVDALLESVAKQDVAPDRIVIVGNGCPLPEFARRLSLPGEVTTVELDENPRAADAEVCSVAAPLRQNLDLRVELKAERTQQVCRPALSGRLVTSVRLREDGADRPDAATTCQRADRT